MAIPSTLVPPVLPISNTDNCYNYAAGVTLDADIPLTRGLLVTHSSSGAVVVKMSNGDNVTFNWHAATTLIFPIRCTRVLSSGTTASANYVALY